VEVIKANEALSMADSPNGHAVEVSGRNQHLRFLRTMTCPTVGSYPLLSIDRAMEEAGVRPFSNGQSPAEILVAKVASRLRFMRNILRVSNGPVFVSFMGFSESKTFPFSYWNEIIPYCFDCWPNSYERWTSLFKRHRIRIAFFTARQSAQHFASVLPNMKSVWLPEATDPFEYNPSISWLRRDIDVLELGRKDDLFHNRIADPLAKAKRSHFFERVKGEIVFPDRAGLVEGLARSKISICFPSSQTHPERSGTVETVTLRYFESIASKCLILGHAPQELIDLFGYNPVIEVEWGREFEQIEFLMNSEDKVQALREKNYKRLLEVGTWKIRVAETLEVLAKFSF
jgi:hypothetical protein